MFFLFYEWILFFYFLCFDILDHFSPIMYNLIILFIVPVTLPKIEFGMSPCIFRKCQEKLGTNKSYLTHVCQRYPFTLRSGTPTSADFVSWFIC